MIVKEDKSLNKENSNQICLRQIRNEYDDFAEIYNTVQVRNHKAVSSFIYIAIKLAFFEQL